MHWWQSCWQVSCLLFSVASYWRPMLLRKKRELLAKNKNGSSWKSRTEPGDTVKPGASLPSNTLCSRAITAIIAKAPISFVVSRGNIELDRAERFCHRRLPYTLLLGHNDGDWNLSTWGPARMGLRNVYEEYASQRWKLRDIDKAIQLKWCAMNKAGKWIIAALITSLQQQKSSTVWTSAQTSKDNSVDWFKTKLLIQRVAPTCKRNKLATFLRWCPNIVEWRDSSQFGQ